MIVAREKLVICRLDGLVMQNTKHLFNSIMGSFKLSDSALCYSTVPESSSQNWIELQKPPNA